MFDVVEYICHRENTAFEFILIAARELLVLPASGRPNLPLTMMCNEVLDLRCKATTIFFGFQRGMLLYAFTLLLFMTTTLRMMCIFMN